MGAAREVCDLTGSREAASTHPKARLFIEQIFADGLREYRPSLPPASDESGQFAGVRQLTEIRWPRRGLFESCCAELFNHIVEEAPYQRCQNTTCERLFVRHQGRSQRGQHRSTGVKYCSHRCATSVAQRKYRDKQRDKKKQTEES